MVIDILNDLEKKGMLVELYRAGIISPRIKLWHDVSNMVDREMKFGNSKSVSVTRVAEVMRMNEKSVYRILRKLRG